jgi:hypothetical protein
MWGLCVPSHVVVFVACTTSRRRPQGNRGSRYLASDLVKCSVYVKYIDLCPSRVPSSNQPCSPGRCPSGKNKSPGPQQTTVEHHHPCADPSQHRGHRHVHSEPLGCRQCTVWASWYCRVTKAQVNRMPLKPSAGIAHGFMAILHITWKTSAVCSVLMLTATGT